jgi:glutathione synthase/RimK-type ligase-like ATP-grasp enzyme
MGARPRICFVTCARWPEVSASDAHAQAALERLGAEVEPRAWNLPDQSLLGFDAVVLRSNWDYHFELDRFRDWLAGLDALGDRVWNPPALVRWNLDKRYLLELERAGIPVVPTAVLPAGEEAQLGALVAARGWRDVVVKPAVSASAYGTRRLGAAEATRVAGELRADGGPRDWLVQPFVAELASAGEWSVVFFDGELTHAVLKVPSAEDFRVQARFGGHTELALPPEPVRRGAARALAALPVAPLYARVDGIVVGDGFLVMEIEVHEPGLFLDRAPAVAAERFAEAILRRVRG